MKPGLTIVGPFLDAINDPNPPWRIDMAIIYPDGNYIRVAENYTPLPKKVGGGGTLAEFSYHYGPCNHRRDKEGFPTFLRDCALRIDRDMDWRSRHIHYQGEDHISEDRLPGLDFAKINPFEFIRAVEKHRETSQPLHEILGFTVEPVK